MSLVFAHRGLHREERENTLDAFRAAVSLGVDGVELDVRRTVDGALVVHHDPRADGLEIARTRQRDLPRYVPTLDEAMDACGDVTVNVEIKNLEEPGEAYDASGDFARAVLADLRQGGWRDRVLVSSFDQATCCVVRSFDPAVAVGWLLWEVDPLGALTQAHVLEFQAVHPHFGVVDEAFMDRARELGLAVNVWTVNAEADVARVLALGVDAIITDDPALVMAMVRSRR